MALLTRTRRPSDRANRVGDDTLDRAREVSDQVAGRAREVSGEVVERASEVADRAREAAAPTVARARDAAAPAVARARDASRPAAARVSSAIGSVLRLVVRVVALVPGLGASVLGGVAQVLGRLADRSAELAHVEPPSMASRRTRRRRSALWFAGGFLSGAAAGYAANQLLRGDERDHAPAPREDALAPGTAGTPAAAPTPTHAVPSQG